ncbi:peptide-methionine (S)-S-oxide reductase, partial [Bacillus pumilus]
PPPPPPYFPPQDAKRDHVEGLVGSEMCNKRQVCTNTTGHREAVQITFDPDVFPYEKLLELYWQQIDPTDDGGQFGDRGESYR